MAIFFSSSCKRKLSCANSEVCCSFAARFLWRRASGGRGGRCSLAGGIPCWCLLEDRSDGGENVDWDNINFVMNIDIYINNIVFMSIIVTLIIIIIILLVLVMMIPLICLLLTPRYMKKMFFNFLISVFFCFFCLVFYFQLYRNVLFSLTFFLISIFSLPLPPLCSHFHVSLTISVSSFVSPFPSSSSFQSLPLSSSSFC